MNKVLIICSPGAPRYVDAEEDKVWMEKFGSYDNIQEGL